MKLLCSGSSGSAPSGCSRRLPSHSQTCRRAWSPGQTALVYFMAGAELMAFVVSPTEAQIVRNLATVSALEDAQAQLRFQLGRVEIGAGYQERHQARLLDGTRNALRRHYDLLIAPLRPYLQEQAPERLLIIPYGSLHLAPFHAFWDGARLFARIVRSLVCF